MDTKVHDIIKPKINIVRFAFLSAILCIIMVLSLSFYGDEFALIIKKLEGSDNDMENVIWIAKHIGNLLPTIAIVIIQGIAYSFVKDKAVSNKERKWQMFTLIVFVYACLLPYTVNGAGLAAIESSSLWFCTQIIPLVILMLYYSQRLSVICAGEDKSDSQNENEITEKAEEIKE